MLKTEKKYVNIISFKYIHQYQSTSETDTTDNATE